LREDFDFQIVTGDRDVGASLPFENVTFDDWQLVGEVEVFYASFAWMAPYALRRLLNGVRWDVLYLNSFFSPRFTITPLVLRRLGLINRGPVVLAPRGELSPGALRLKRAKKRCFLWLARLVGLYRDVIWQASSEREAADIREWFPGGATDASSNARIRIAGNLTAGDVSKFEYGGSKRHIFLATDLVLGNTSGVTPKGRGKTPGSLNIVFLSRISPMKNLDYALNIVSRLNGRVSFDIYGPVDAGKDGGYWLQCQRLMDEMPPSVKVDYKGVVEPNRVGSVFSQYDVFLLPTRGENFGHVIAESLCAGCPVVISDQTPWRNLEEGRAGWALPLDRQSTFVEVLQRLLEMDAEEHKGLSNGARRFALIALNSDEAVRQNRELFEYAASLRGKDT
jgi:glycosyltransferase involved in cell wall biosynthesis